MERLRTFLNSHAWIGWVVAVVALGLAASFALGVFRPERPDSVERRSEDVTIRCTETGNTWTMNRGEFERLLLTTPGPIDPESGIPSRFAEGRPTGVLVDDSDWRAT
ncbi:MAG: hypothetical protein KDA28_16570, partial [Phycisphaerales bacterium]|nr:hypothetical protein [Phycisphaerales bacterium]